MDQFASKKLAFEKKGENDVITLTSHNYNYSLLKSFKKDLLERLNSIPRYKKPSASIEGEKEKNAKIQKYEALIKQLERGKRPFTRLLTQIAPEYQKIKKLDLRDRNRVERDESFKDKVQQYKKREKTIASLSEQRQTYIRTLKDYSQMGTLTGRIKMTKEDLEKKVRQIEKRLLEEKNEREKEFKEKKLRFFTEKRIELRELFKTYPSIKKIVGYHEEWELIEESSQAKKYSKLIEDTCKRLKKKTKELKKEAKWKVLQASTGKKLTFTETLLLILKNADISINVINRNKITNLAKLEVSLNQKKLYSSFFQAVSSMYRHDIYYYDVSSRAKNTIEKMVSPRVKNLIKFKYDKDENSFSIQLKIEELVNELWKKARVDSIVKKAQPRSNHRVRKVVIVVASIVAIVIFASVFVVPAIFPGPTVVEKYDQVEIYYTAWMANSWEGYDENSPIHDASIVVDVVPLNDPDLVTLGDGLILGLYDNLLGKRVDYQSEPIWLDRCVDQNYDGIDDELGTPALTFGNGTNLYFNTPLTIQFKVLEIQKDKIHKPELRLDQVSPEIGLNTTEYNFTAWYYHEDDTFPESISVKINRSEYAMKPTTQSNNVEDGLKYYFSAKLQYGYYGFQVVCSDGRFKSSTEWKEAPEVNPFYGMDETKIRLHNPLDGASISEEGINFSWISLGSELVEVNYELQISITSDFKYVIYEVLNVQEKEYYSNLTIIVDRPSNIYYWRVRATYGPFYGEWSESSEFSLVNPDFYNI